jgi:hypothetical protein
VRFAGGWSLNWRYAVTSLTSDDVESSISILQSADISPPSSESNEKQLSPQDDDNEHKDSNKATKRLQELLHARETKLIDVCRENMHLKEQLDTMHTQQATGESNAALEAKLAKVTEVCRWSVLVT